MLAERICGLRHVPPAWFPGRRASIALATAFFLATACGERGSTDPVDGVEDAGSSGVCGSECTLISGTAPLQVARFQRDSAEIPVPLGILDVRGEQGARVTLRLSADGEVLRTAGDQARVIVQRDGKTQTFSLAQLQRGVEVHTFTRSEQVRLRYSLERRVSGSLASGRILLVQQLTGPASVVSAERNWVQSAESSLLVQAMATCAITDPVTTGCDNTVTTDPYAPTTFLGATFQSAPGSGQSQPITITFAKPVKAVTIRIVDSDFNGNQMIASDDAGVVGSLSFAFDGFPGNGGLNETRTITAPAGRGITKVQLIPDPREYVAYSGSWESLPPCPPTGDPNLDDPVNREKFDSSFQAGNPFGPEGDRKEHIRAGYRFPDGHVESVDLNPPNANNCEIKNLFVPATNGEGKLIWIWHSHPYAPGDVATQCGGKVLSPPVPYPAVPSDPDWRLLDAVNNLQFTNGEPAVPGYIYDKKQTYRMNPNAFTEPSPPNKYATFDRPACS
jgi:hypothetical protein